MNRNMFELQRIAAREIAALGAERIDAILLAVADAVEARAAELLEANAADCAALDNADPRYDRLLLNGARIADIAEGIRAVAALPSPLDVTLESTTRPNGMLIRKVSVPLRRDRSHLRGPAQCGLRRLRPLLQGRKRMPAQGRT